MDVSLPPFPGQLRPSAVGILLPVYEGLLDPPLLLGESRGIRLCGRVDAREADVSEANGGAVPLDDPGLFELVAHDGDAAGPGLVVGEEPGQAV